MAAQEGAASAQELEEEFLQAQCGEVLDQCARTAAVPAEALEGARRKYQRLHVAMLQTLSDAAALEGRVEQLSAQLERIRAQQVAVAAAEAGGFQDLVEILDKFREDRDAALDQASQSSDRAQAATVQLRALGALRDKLNSKLVEMEDERRAELAPQIKAAQDDIDILREHMVAERAKAEAARKDVADVAARLETLQLEIQGLKRVAEQEQAALLQSQKLPERCRRDADLAVNAIKELQKEEEELGARAKELEAAESSWAKQAKEVSAQQDAVARAGDKLRAAIRAKERNADEVQRDIDMGRLENERHLAERVTLDLETERRAAEAKREGEAVKAELCSRDVAVRRLNHAELEAKEAQDMLPPLKTAASNMSTQLGDLRKQLAAAATSRAQLQREVERVVKELAAEKNLTKVQAALVKVSMQDVQELDGECAEVRAAVARRDKLAQETASRRDAASRQVSQWVAKLREALDAAELKDGEVEELRQQRSRGKAQGKELRELCEIMSEQVERMRAVCQSARGCVADLESKVQGAEAQLREMEGATASKRVDLKQEERQGEAAEASRALLASRLAALRRERAGAAKEADHASLEVQRLQRAVEEGEEAARRLRCSKEEARAAKEAAQQVLLARDDELCRLYTQSDACQSLMDEGTRTLSRCDDDIRVLQLEVAELHRQLFATQKTAPDVATYDRNIAALKAEVFRARREAEQLSGALEDPKLTAGRWRVLPGPIPSQADLADRASQIDSRLTTRHNQIAQKDLALDELQRLIDSLVQKAAGSHDGAFQLSVQMNECQRGLQGMTRRMMAAVSELALYQALALKHGADRDALRSEVAAARQNVDAGRPPTADADKDFARMERDRAQQAEVRAQAAELRRLHEAGLLGGGQPPASTAAPRPHAYLPADAGDGGLPRPFLAPFAPFKPSSPLHLPAAMAAARRARGGCGSPTPPQELLVAQL